jgi:MYXO-CTERM domain-containing protein
VRSLGTGIFSALLAGTLLFGSRAAAEDLGVADCSPPVLLGPLEFFPAAGAGGVALNSAVRVRYTPGFFDVWRDPLTSLLEVRDASGAAVPGALEQLGDTLVFRPNAPWSPSSSYQGTAFGIDILRARFTFQTGTRIDVQPPVFDGTPAIAPATVDARPCMDGGYRIDVSVDPATDSDGAGGDIEYLLFQTRGPHIERPVLRARVRNFAGISIPLTFTLSPSEAVSPICVAVLAVDGVGHVVEGSNACVDPIQGNFFEPLCSVSAPGAARKTSPMQVGAWSLAMLALAVLLRRRAR